MENKNEYAITNVLQSLENAITYCSYLNESSIRWELEELFERTKKSFERKYNKATKEN